jgi:hypothetical protein
MAVRRTGCTAGLADPVGTADGVATAVEAAGDGVVAAPAWIGCLVGQDSTGWPLDAALGSNTSTLDSETDGTSPPAISTFLEWSRVAVCSQRA